MNTFRLLLQEDMDHSVVLISPKIEKQAGINPLFDEILKTALSEIYTVLDEEFHGRIGYIIEIDLEKDYEFPEWVDTVITIKVPIDISYVIPLYLKIEEMVRKKIKSIKANVKEIEKISYHLDTSVEILE
jgi:hypothetical protein